MVQNVTVAGHRHSRNCQSLGRMSLAHLLSARRIRGDKSSVRLFRFSVGNSIPLKHRGVARPEIDPERDRYV